MGHAYSSIIADFFARFKTIDNFNVHFLTGTDEHGLKIQRSAEKAGLVPQKFCDDISKTFRFVSNLNLSNTDFIRTTEERHKKQFNIFGIYLKKMMIFIYQITLDGIQFQTRLFIIMMK